MCITGGVSRVDVKTTLRSSKTTGELEDFFVLLVDFWELGLFRAYDKLSIGEVIWL